MWILSCTMLCSTIVWCTCTYHVIWTQVMSVFTACAFVVHLKTISTHKKKKNKHSFSYNCLQAPECCCVNASILCIFYFIWSCKEHGHHRIHTRRSWISWNFKISISDIENTAIQIQGISGTFIIFVFSFYHCINIYIFFHTFCQLLQLSYFSAPLESFQIHHLSQWFPIGTLKANYLKSLELKSNAVMKLYLLTEANMPGKCQLQELWLRNGHFR